MGQGGEKVRFFIVFVLTKLFILDVVCGYLLYKLMKQKRELNHYVELQLLNESRVKQLEHANTENELSARRLERRLNIMEGYRTNRYGKDDETIKERFCAFSIGNRHKWKKLGEMEVRTIRGTSRKYYEYKCEECGKVKTTDSPLMEEVQ
jgi:hypothetical protein